MNDFNKFIEAIKREDLEKVKSLFKREFINEKFRQCKAFHVACVWNNKSDIVKYLMNEGFDIEEKIVQYGGKCIHLSAMYGTVEVMKALLEKECDIDCLNKEGMLPLDVALKYKKDQCVELLEKAKIDRQNRTNEDLNLLEKNNLSKIMDIKSGKLLLDKLMNNKNPKIMEAIKSKPVTDQEIDEWRQLELRDVDPQSYRLLYECMFARCLYQKYEDGVFDLCTAEIVNKDSLFMGPSALETAMNCGVSILSIRQILWKLMKDDKSWSRAENIAKNKNQERVALLLSKRREYLNEKEENGFSRLHVAVLENDPNMIEYIMKIKDINEYEGQKKRGSALSLSYYIDHKECIETLQNNNVNVNTVDKLKQSPLHIAIYNRRQKYSDYLVDNIIDTEAKDFMNLTVMERSVMNDCKHICERLMKKGAQCEKYVDINSDMLDNDPNLSMILYNIPHLPLTKYETLNTLCFKVNQTIYSGLLEATDKSTVNLPDGDGNTLLHLGVFSLRSDICFQLISKCANANIYNKCGNTPLLELLIRNYNGTGKEVKKEIIEIINVLIDGGASLNVETIDGCSVLEIATKYNNEILLLALIIKRSHLEYIKTEQWLEWIKRKYYTIIKEVIPLISKSHQEQWITKDLIQCCLKRDNFALVKLMYEKTCYEVKIEVVENILYKAAILEDKNVFESLIMDEIRFNTIVSEGDTLLNFLIKGKKIEFIEIIIRSKNGEIFLEKEDIKKRLPIHVCIEYECWEVMDKLITDTISVNHEDIDGNTPLSLLLKKLSENEKEGIIDRLMTYVKTLILKSADIYTVNKLNRTAISYCSKNSLKLKIETFSRKHRNMYTTKENDEIVAASESTIDQICSICEDKPRNCALNCGHVFCMSCAEKDIYCFVCRRPITDRIKLFV